MISFQPISCQFTAALIQTGIVQWPAWTIFGWLLGRLIGKPIQKRSYFIHLTSPRWNSLYRLSAFWLSNPGQKTCAGNPPSLKELVHLTDPAQRQP